MKDQVLGIGQRMWAEFRKFTPGQKFVTVAAVAALVIGGYFLVTWKASPTYAPLFTNLAPADASAIVDKLNADGVAYQLGAGGTEVLVPQDKVYATRLTLSAAGLPGSSETGYSLLDKEGITTSQWKQQIDYQRAVEGELEKTIQSIDGVEAASVHLAIPQQDVFNDGSSKPKAAVLLTVGSSTQLSTAQVQSVVNLVSSSVPGMTAGNVTVSDSNGNVLKAQGEGDTSFADATSQTQATQQYDTAMETKLQSTLDRLLGPNHATVTVSAQLNFDRASSTTQTYLHNASLPAVSQTTTKENYQGAGAGTAGGTLGTTGTSNSGGSGKYTKSSSTVNPALGTQTTTKSVAPGGVQLLSIGVALDKSVKNLDVNAISALVRSGAGFNAARGDTLSVQAVPFDNSAEQAQIAAGAAAAKATAAAASQDKLMGMIKQGGLALLVLVLVVVAAIAAMKRRKAAPEPNDDVLGVDDLADDDDLTTRADLAPVTDLRAAADRRRSLVAVADDRPQDVARVLSGWLNAKES